MHKLSLAERGEIEEKRCIIIEFCSKILCPQLKSQAENPHYRRETMQKGDGGHYVR